MGKTTFSGPVNSLAGFEVNGTPLDTTAPTGATVETAALIESAGEAITIPVGTSIDAALKILADAIDP